MKRLTYNRKVYYILFLAIVFTACKKESEVSIQTALQASSYFNYAPHAVLLYEGDSIVYNDFDNSVDTLRFYYKDSLVGIDSLDTEIAFQFERSHSNNGLEYQYLKNYTINLQPQGIVRTEDLHTRFLLPFSFNKDSKWNGNQYQTGDPEEYFIENISTIEYAGGMRSMLEVQQMNEKNLIREDVRQEYYLEGIGLKYLYSKGVNKNISTGNISSGNIVILNHKQ